MAKEEDLKKVELKVYANCCDGCKRKIKKALRSVDGVLKTEIDPVQPKVTVVGKVVDPQVLIKKLIKVGKQAQLWSQSTVSENASNANESAKKEQVPTTDTKAKAATKEAKSNEDQLGSCNTTSYKGDDSCSCKHTPAATATAAATTSADKVIKNIEIDDTHIPINPTNHQVFVNASLHQKTQPETQTQSDCETIEVKNCTPQHQYCYMVDPNNFDTNTISIPLPYYPIASYVSMPTNYASFERSVPLIYTTLPAPTPTLAPSDSPSPLGDYFSDDNTVGCHVM